MPFSGSDILAGIGALAALFGVLVLTYYGTRWYARRLGGGVGVGKDIQILERVAVGGNAYLAIVGVNERFYLIGVGEKGINLLSELEGFSPRQNDAHSKLPFEKMFSDMLKKIGKGSGGGDDQSA